MKKPSPEGKGFSINTNYHAIIATGLEHVPGLYRTTMMRKIPILHKPVNKPLSLLTGNIGVLYLISIQHYFLCLLFPVLILQAYKIYPGFCIEGMYPVCIGTCF